MSLDWSTICPVVQQQIAAVAELPEIQVTWRDQAQPYNPNALVKLRNVSIRSDGIDVDYLDDDANRWIEGQRVWTLNIIVEAVSQEFESWAPTFTERIRTRFMRSTTRAKLAAGANVAVRDDLPTVDVPMVDGDRTWSKYLTPYTLASSFREQDTSDGAGDWIERVEIAGLGQVQVVTLGRQFDLGFDSGFQRNSP